MENLHAELMFICCIHSFEQEEKIKKKEDVGNSFLYRL